MTNVALRPRKDTKPCDSSNESAPICKVLLGWLSQPWKPETARVLSLMRAKKGKWRHHTQGLTGPLRVVNLRPVGPPIVSLESYASKPCLATFLRP
jgi:hypothetical protein